MEKIKEKKGGLIGMVKLNRSIMSNKITMPGSRSPQTEVRELSSALEVILSSCLMALYMCFKKDPR